MADAIKTSNPWVKVIAQNGQGPSNVGPVAMPATQQGTKAVANKFGTTKAIRPVWAGPTPPSQK